MEQYFKIGEISRLYGIGADTIRYYEEQGLIHPVRGENGYRMYSIRDVWRMNVIRDLRALGFPVERIGAYLEDRSVDSTIALLREELAVVDSRLAELGRLRQNVSARLASIEAGQAHPIGAIERVALPARHCHQIQQRYSTDAEMDLLIKRLISGRERELYIIGNSSIGCRITLEHLEAGELGCYDAAFVLQDDGPVELAGGDYLTVRYRGSTRQTAAYGPRLLQHAKKEGLTPAGDLLEFIWIDIHESADMREHLTELQLRVE